MTETGHNSNAQLKSIVERIERIEEEITESRSDVSDIYKEAKGNGYDVPALKAIVRARREDAEKRQAREAQIDIYRSALGID
jgi:uncharacterized protein (UPF0335 family)